MTPDIDPNLQTWLDEDAARDVVEPGELETLWGTLETELDQAGPRDALVSLSTPARMAIAVLVIISVGAVAIGAQGLRPDLDAAGWARFAMLGGPLLMLGGVTALWPLRSRAAAPAPLWPWIAVAWVVLLVVSTVAPWPGMTGVPAAMHGYCMGVTTAIGALAALGLWSLERSYGPVPMRIGTLAVGAGMAAFVFQSVFCPGVDVIHLLVGHGSPAIGLSLIAIGGATLMRR